MKKMIANLLLLVSFMMQCGRVNDEKTADISTPAQVTVPDTFHAAFYNVENLFDVKDNRSEYPEFLSSSGWNQILLNKKLENIASVIAAMNVSIIGLCEIENSEVLSLLQKTLKEKKCFYPYSAIADKPFRSATNTAILSRFPIKNVNTFPVKTDSGGSRNILEADINLGKSHLEVFVNHWPSKGHPESFRVAAAQVLNDRLRQLQAQTDYIIMGDLNTDYNEISEFKKSKLNDTKGITGLNSILGTVCKNNGAFLTESELMAKNAGHYDLWLDLPASRRMSHVFNRRPGTLDHILLPYTLYDSTGVSYLDNSFKVFSFNGKLLKEGIPYRWQYRWIGKKKVHAGEGYSDHLPIISGFTMHPFRFDSTKNPNSEMRNDNLISGFEDVSQNFISGSSHAAIQLDSVKAVQGHKALKISCDNLRGNCTVLRIPVNMRKVNSNNSFLQVFALGSGKFSFRIRPTGGDWVYYNADEFTPSKTAHYKSWHSEKWIKIPLVIPKSFTRSEELEFEVRAGKGEPFSILLDELSWES